MGEAMDSSSLIFLLGELHLAVHRRHRSVEGNPMGFSDVRYEGCRFDPPHRLTLVVGQGLEALRLSSLLS